MGASSSKSSDGDHTAGLPISAQASETAMRRLHLGSLTNLLEQRYIHTPGLLSQASRKVSAEDAVLTRCPPDNVWSDPAYAASLLKAKMLTKPLVSNEVQSELIKMPVKSKKDKKKATKLMEKAMNAMDPDERALNELVLKFLAKVAREPKNKESADKLASSMAQCFFGRKGFMSGGSKESVAALSLMIRLFEDQAKKEEKEKKEKEKKAAKKDGKKDSKSSKTGGSGKSGSKHHHHHHR